MSRVDGRMLWERWVEHVEPIECTALAEGWGGLTALDRARWEDVAEYVEWKWRIDRAVHEDRLRDDTVREVLRVVDELSGGCMPVELASWVRMRLGMEKRRCGDPT